MTQSAGNTTFVSKPWFTVVLLIIVVGEFAAGYYFWGQKKTEIEALSITIRDQNLNIDAAEAKMTRLEKTIKEFEAGGAAAPASGGGAVAEYEYTAGSVANAWNKLNEARKQFQGTAQGAELGDLLTTQDFNGVRGADLGEISCFEELIGSGEHPLLKALFEHNAREAIRSGDLGTSMAVLPGLENLLAFYVSVGDEGSLNFVKGLLTTGPAAQLLQTKYNGRYFTGAGAVVAPMLETCVGSAVQTPTP